MIYYLDGFAGNDNDLGFEEESPWKTFNAISTFNFADGDTIKLKRGTIFDHLVTYSHGGTYSMLKLNTNNITIEDYGVGDLPVISGEVNGMLPIRLVSSWGGVNGVTLRNLKFFHPGDDGGIRHLVSVEDCANWVVENCHFDCDHVYTDGKKVSCLTMDGDSPNWHIHNNLFENTTPSDMTSHRDNEHGIYPASSYNIIEFNTIRNIYGQGITFNDGSAPTENIVRFNWIENIGTGITDSGGVRALIHDNVVITSDGSFEGTAEGINLGSDWTSSPTYPRQNFNPKVYHNTVIMKAPASGKSVVGFKIRSGTVGDPLVNAEIKNNIFYAEDGAGTSFFFLSSAVNLNMNSITFDNNLWYAIAGAPTWNINDPSFSASSFAGWQAHPTSPDPNGLNVNPAFNDYFNSDFAIPQTSPCNNGGVKVYDNGGIFLAIDYPQNARDPNTPAIGAYEYVAAGAPTITQDNVPRACLRIEASNYSTLQWYKDGSPIAGETSLAYASADLEEGHDSVYYCKVTGSSVIDSSSIRVVYSSSSGVFYQMIL